MKRTAIERLLPAVFHRTLRREEPLSALLDAMEGLHAPAEARLAHLDQVFDPRRAPAAFVPLLATWVDLARLAEERADGGRVDLTEVVEPERLRELVPRTAELSRWRGTARGLRLFLETATGLTGFEIEEEVAARPFHIQIRCPAAATPYSRLIRRIVELEKPAYVSADVVIEDNPRPDETDQAPASPDPVEPPTERPSKRPPKRPGASPDATPGDSTP